jgi:UDP-N-acetylmuramyl pentapeptide phosphotransferase/UDP-N-acetylglucosamine-1-phosphate transferase
MLLLNPQIYLFLFILLFSFLISAILIPVSKNIALSKNIVAIPTKKSSHFNKIPVTGGIVIFLSSSLSIFAACIFFDIKLELSIVSNVGIASLIMLGLGLLDDKLDIKPYYKLIVQLISTVIILISLGPDLILYIKDSLNSIGVSSQYYDFELSYFITILVIIVFINMINMIDGIDGLLASIFILSCIFFFLFSVYSEKLFIALLTISGLGSLIVFLYHNVLSKNKIFLGDNGSLLIGVILAYLSLDFLSKNSFNYIDNNNSNLLLLSIFIYPITDFYRIVIVRILKKSNPLNGDKNHIHHNLVRLGLSHVSSTLAIIAYTILVTFITYNLLSQDIYILLIFLSLCSLIAAFLPMLLINIKKRR